MASRPKSGTFQRTFSIYPNTNSNYIIGSIVRGKLNPDIQDTISQIFF